jgi:murein L,D-transpeptidase YafK
VVHVLIVRYEITQRFHLFRSYPIAAASGILGPTLCQGDGQIPEGFYHVPSSAMKPNSRFHLAFNIGYPNEYDRAQQRTGDFIMVHGNQVSKGCLAMTDEKIEEIYALCDAALLASQPFFRIHLFPFQMTAVRMAQVKGQSNDAFWQNLKFGYDLFEPKKSPPGVQVVNGKYVFTNG